MLLYQHPCRVLQGVDVDIPRPANIAVRASIFLEELVIIGMYTRLTKQLARASKFKSLLLLSSFCIAFFGFT